MISDKKPEESQFAQERDQNVIPIFLCLSYTFVFRHPDNRTQLFHTHSAERKLNDFIKCRRWPTFKKY